MLLKKAQQKGVKVAKKPINLKIGAPSLTGIDANALITKNLTANDFPQKIVVKNLVHHAINFPEFELSLTGSINPKGSEGSLTIPSIQVIHELASNIEQVAELHQYNEFVSIDCSTFVVDIPLVAVDKPKPEKPTKALVKTSAVADLEVKKES
jgi:hypothetical protein